jgi:hypothetical protein
MDALRRGEVIPSVQQLADWANSTATLKAGSLHLFPDRWAALLGPSHPASVVAREGSVLKMIPEAERPRPRSPWQPPSTQNERKIAELMLFQAIEQGAVVPIGPAEMNAARSAGIRPAKVALFCVSKNKPQPQPREGNAAACVEAGPTVTSALLRHFRLVADFKTNGVNEGLEDDPYPMGSAKSMRPLVRFRDLVTTTDVRSAYWCTFLKKFFLAMLQISSSSPKVAAFLRRHKAIALAWAVPTFGIKSAGRIFTDMLEAALGFIRSMGVRIHSIMDDCATFSNGDSPQQRLSNSLRDAGIVIITLTFLGFPFSLEKNEVTPSHNRLFGGAVIDTVLMRHFSSQAKVAKFRAEWFILLTMMKAHRIPSSASGSTPTLRMLARANGQVASLLDTQHGLKAEAAAMVQTMAEATRLQWKHRPPGPFAVNYEAALPRTGLEVTIKTLEALCEPQTLKALDGTPVHLLPMRWALVVDSDKLSRGYYFGKARSRPSVGSRFFKRAQRQTRFFSAQHASKHSVFAEPAGVALALMEEILEHDIRDCHIGIFSDSTTAVAVINHGGSRSLAVSKIFTDLGFFQLLRRRNIWASAEHMEGDEMILNGTDGASRMAGEKLILCEIAASKSLVRQVEAWSGSRISVDMMASEQNHVATTFITRRFSPLAAATDAFSQCWKAWWQKCQGILWCFPPPGSKSLARALERIEAAQAPTALVMPLDPSCSSVVRALKISNFLPFLWVPSMLTVEYPHRVPMATWLKDRTASKSISSAEVWMVAILFGKTQKRGSADMLPWTRPLSRSYRDQWRQNLSERATEHGAASLISAATLAETLGSRAT